MSKKSILIIDDETIIIRALTRALEKEGFSVLFSQDGEAGFEKITKENPSLILLDFLMPKLNGLEVLEKMQKTHIQIPVIFMTAYGDRETQKLSKKFGVSAYLTKPFGNIYDVIFLVKEKIK